MKEALSFVRDQLGSAQQRQATNANRRRREAAFAVGDQVLLSTEGLQLRGFTNKLCSRFVGPFPVTAIVNANAYTLALPPQLQALHPTFNIDRLKPYRDGKMEFPTRPLAHSRPPPIAEADTNGEAVYEVERVVAQRKRGRAVEYLVEWKGYPAEENTWEPHRKLATTAADALADFEAAQQSDAALGLAAADSEPADYGTSTGNGSTRTGFRHGKATLMYAQRTVTRRYEGPLCRGQGCRRICGPDYNCPENRNYRCHCPPSGTGPLPELCLHCADDETIVNKLIISKQEQAARAARTAPRLAPAIPLGE